MIRSILLLATCFAGDGPEIGYTELLSIVKDSQATESATFLYEGTVRYLGDDPESSKKVEELDFQGSYSRRKDGAVFLDVYIKNIENSKNIKHVNYAILNKKSISLSHRPGKRPALEDIRQHRSDDGALRLLYSPEQVMFNWFFPRLDENDATFLKNYVFEGWEAVGGRRCLRFRLDGATGTRDERKNYKRFWIDLDRGAHVVKSEHFLQASLAARIDDVQLTRVRGADGKDYWHPIRGTYSTFIKDVGKYSGKPVIQVKCIIVDEALGLNSKLPDDHFSVFRRPGLPQPEQLARLERDFHASRQPRRDFAAVRATLEARLEEADQQSERLEASSAAQADSLPWSILAIGSVVSGALLVATAAYMKWRAR